ncbi:Translation initiation factor 3 protein [Striga hermonthica]|uniref:Translation initiation factor 3 protein n=1 Tax=Striga hermonthica TaxID=68872 RepID=A0A9N7MJB8_STRHE|nr:Translation initiation factor 3 protein [Striga hermonthica]
MAGLTSTFHHPCKSNLCKPLKPSSFHLRIFSLRIGAPTTGGCLSISTIRTTISARYGGGGSFQRYEPSYEDEDDDEALDISSISSDTVRLIDEQQKMVGIIPKAQAVQMANDAKLQLVILSPDADPPVVKIMNYDKYRYKQQKKTRDQQKKSMVNILMSFMRIYNIDVHDYSVRLKAAHKFLKDGDKVKVIVNMKGREKEFRNNAIELLKRFQVFPSSSEPSTGELAPPSPPSRRRILLATAPRPSRQARNRARRPRCQPEPPVLRRANESLPSSSSHPDQLFSNSDKNTSSPPSRCRAHQLAVLHEVQLSPSRRPEPPLRPAPFSRILHAGGPSLHHPQQSQLNPIAGSHCSPTTSHPAR